MAGIARALAGGAALTTMWGGVVVCLTWPLAAHLGTHLPDTSFGTAFDTLLIGWVLSYSSRALAGGILHAPPASIYHPTPHALFYCETGFGSLPLFAPPFLVTHNPTLALNLTLLASVALTAAAVHALVHHWTGSHLGGFVAASSLLTTRWLLWEWGPVAPNYALLVWMPFIILLGMTRHTSLASALRIVPPTVLQSLASIYLAVGVFVPLALIAAARLSRRATRAAGARLLGALAIAGLTLVPAYAGYVLVFLENPALHEQSVWRHVATLPTRLPWGPLSPRQPLTVPLVVFPIVVAGGVLFFRRPRSSRAATGTVWPHVLFWTVCTFALSLMPMVSWYGAPVRLPHWHLPFGGVIRVPQRIGEIALIGVTMLAGLGFVECTRWTERVPRRWLGVTARTTAALALAAAMYHEYVHGHPALPLRRLALPAVYPTTAAIGPDDAIVRLLGDGAGAVLELPVGEATAPWPAWNAAAMYRSIFHRRPILNGYCSYWPAGFSERIAQTRRLPDRDAVAALRAETGLTTIVVHLADLSEPQRAPWQALAERPDGSLRLVGRAGDDLVFAVGP